MSLKINTEHHYFMKDGVPFFWTADTCWSAFTNITEEDWKYYLDKRKAQGFNVIQINILPQWDASSTSLNWSCCPLKEDGTLDWSCFEDSYFKHARRFCEIAKNFGFELALVLLWCNYVPGTWASRRRIPMPFEALDPYIDIVHKTFSDLDPVYIVSGDTDFLTEESERYYTYAAQKIKMLAPRCLMTTHLKGWYTYIPDLLLPYLDFLLYQSGHNPQDPGMSYKLAEQFRERYGSKLLINAEPCYEEMGYIGQQFGRWTRYDVRKASYSSVLSGANAGISYGAAGIYSWHSATQKFYNSLGESFADPKSWQEALSFEGAWDIGYLHFLIENYQLYDLQSNQSLIKNKTSEIRAGENASCIAIYLPINIPLEIDDSLIGKKGLIIDLQTRFVAPLTITQSKIPVNYFHQDSLYILFKENMNGKGA